jgi:hypothetical protein
VFSSASQGKRFNNKLNQITTVSSRTACALSLNNPRTKLFNQSSGTELVRMAPIWAYTPSGFSEEHIELRTYLKMLFQNMETLRKTTTSRWFAYWQQAASSIWEVLSSKSGCVPSFLFPFLKNKCFDSILSSSGHNRILLPLRIHHCHPAMRPYIAYATVDRKQGLKSIAA